MRKTQTSPKIKNVTKIFHHLYLVVNFGIKYLVTLLCDDCRYRHLKYQTIKKNDELYYSSCLTYFA